MILKYFYLHLRIIFVIWKQSFPDKINSRHPSLKTEVTYLGHMVSKNGVKTDPEKLNALKALPVPSDARLCVLSFGITADS